MQKDSTIKLFKKIPNIDTPRLLLRRMKVSDSEDMYEYSCQDKVTKYLLWQSHPDHRYTKDYLSYIQGRYRAGEFYDWAIVHKDSGKMIGTCGFAKLDFENNSAEVGYVLNPVFWNCGYATEALKHVVDFGFRVLNLHRIEARYIVGNEVSRRVMEKCGMTFEGIHRSSLLVKYNYVSVGYCAVTAEEYISGRHLL